MQWANPSSAICECGYEMPVYGGIVSYTSDDILDETPEAKTRNRQASGYLEHSKFPTQVERVRQFLNKLPSFTKELPALDLGCGPGPYSQYLLGKGYRVIAVDFSKQNIILNHRSCDKITSDESHAHVIADLNSLHLSNNSTKLLMMCDFLQHLGDEKARKNFLDRAFSWLIPGGYFYLSCFNYNLKNRFKRDKRGSFGNGSILYERCSLEEVLGMLPDNIVLDSVKPMNIFHGARADQIASRLPFAFQCARMISLSGRLPE